MFDEAGDTPGQSRVSRRDLRLPVPCERRLATRRDYIVRCVGPLSGDLRLHYEKGNEVKCREIIADSLSKVDWSWGCVSAIDSSGHTIWIADAHRDDGKRFVVRAAAFLAFLRRSRAPMVRESNNDVTFK